MSKPLYTTLIVFLTLTAVSGLLQGILRQVIGPSFPLLDAFIPLFITSTIITLAGALLLLLYYHYRRYWFPFYSGIVSIIAASCYSIAVYKILVSGTMMSYFPLLLSFSVLAWIVNAISLISSPAGKHPWLMAAGCAGAIVGLLMLTPFIGGIYFAKIAEWATVAGSLTPLLFCIHFLKERTSAKADTAQTESLRIVLGFVTAAALIATLVSGVMISSDSYYSLYWTKRNFEKTQQLAQLFEAHTFINSHNDTLRYRLLKPLHYDPSKKYPLVISLPFGGEPATDLVKQIDGAAAADFLSADSNRIKYPAFLFIPHCAPNAGWGGVPGLRTVDTIVFEAIRSLDKTLSIDTTRRYISGISKGGYGTWHFICTRPDLFAAAIPVCGAGDPGLAAKIVNVPVWAFHGSHDRNVPVSGSREMIASIKQAGGHPKYTEFPDEAHNIWYKVTAMPEVWDWLFAQKNSHKH
jgi:hypothetical protein